MSEVQLTGEEIDALRQRIVARARGEIGPGQRDVYWRSALGPSWRGPFPKHWCGAFTLWALHSEGVGCDAFWKAGIGYVSPKWITRKPQPGDVAYYDQPFQHYAVVAEVVGDTVITIDGNQPDVRQRTRKLTAGVYYSIEALFPAVYTESAP